MNQKYSHVFAHSPLTEFLDHSRKKICLLDDNFLGFPRWREYLEELMATGKPFKFKQGLDERILTEEKAKILFSSKYDGDFTFAFDNVEDYDIIKEKLKIIDKYRNGKSVKFYVLCGFTGTGADDIESVFKRIELLMEYHCLPYIMRYKSKNGAPWENSKYRGMYIQLARWCNQPSFVKKTTIREFEQINTKDKETSSCKRALDLFENDYPEIAKKYFNLRWR